MLDNCHSIPVMKQTKREREREERGREGEREEERQVGWAVSLKSSNFKK